MVKTALISSCDKLETHSLPNDGLHIISNFVSKKKPLLEKHLAFKKYIDVQINELALTKVGEAYHDFEGGGYTGVVCLAESHLSIHTWPDRGYVTFDIFLSNYSKDNSPKASALYKSVIDYFEASVVFENKLHR